jgi:hypothetical protein
VTVVGTVTAERTHYDGIGNRCCDEMKGSENYNEDTVKIKGQVVNTVRDFHAHSLYKFVAMFGLRCLKHVKTARSICCRPNL